MPELPEVELIKKGLEKYVKGLEISKVRVRNKKVVEGEIAEVCGAKLTGVRRFGKMLAIDLANGKSLAVHVKMTGRLIYRGERQPKDLQTEEEYDNLPNKHTHVIFEFRNGDKLYYNDVRKFGWIRVLNTDEVKKMLFVAKLGPEPFKDLTLEKFSEILSAASCPIKTLLMDQEKISGVGNIYANEALFCAGIMPTRVASRINRQEVLRLYKCMLKVLREGIRYGGSSTDSFRDVLGRKGAYQNRYYAYDRSGKKCRRRGCKGTIIKKAVSGRGTYYCSKCQN